MRDKDKQIKEREIKTGWDLWASDICHNDFKTIALLSPSCHVMSCQSHSKRNKDWRWRVQDRRKDKPNLHSKQAEGKTKRNKVENHVQNIVKMQVMWYKEYIKTTL